MATWQLEVLGTVSLRGAGKTLRPERKTVAVLTYLALEGATSRSRLAGLLWADSEEATARNNLAQLLRRLKKVTDTALVIGDDLLSLTSAIEVDAANLKVLSFEGSYNQLLALSDEALRGELLAPHDYDDCPDFADWLFAERERIASLRKDALAGEMTRLERSGELREALELAEALVGQDTLSEEAHRQVMRLHYLLGDRAAALKAFERCRVVLEKELAVEPTRETEQLAKQIEDGKVETQLVTTKTAIPLNVLRPPLVGRENELAQLAETWKLKKIAFVRGEPGVGKSRLVADFLGEKTTLRVEGRPGDTLPFASYTRAVRQWLRHHPVDLPSWVKRELSRLDPSLSSETPSNDTLRLSEAVTELLRLLSVRLLGIRLLDTNLIDTNLIGVNKLQAIVMDDLQFMDTASFELSRYLLSTFVGSDLRIVASYRSGEVSDETSLMQFVQAGQAVLVDVRPLDSTMTSRLLEQIHLAELKGLGEAMQSSTGGNPMFIIETIKHLIENKRLDISPDKLPNVSKVSSLIQKRLEQLSPNALRLAQVAAVAGTDFDLDLASTVLETHLLDLSLPFSELENKQVMRGQAFVHDLLFESTVASIPAPIKTLLQLRIARVLDKNGQRAKAAQHYLDSRSSWQENDTIAAVASFTEVARSISMTGDLQGGAVWFDRAFELAPDKPIRARILTERAKLLERHLQYQAAMGLLDQAETLAVTADAVTRAAIWNTRSIVLYEAFADFEGSQRFAQQALDSLQGLETDEAKVETSSALKYLGGIAWQKQEFDKAERYYKQALEILRVLGRKEKTAEVLNNLGLVMLENNDSSAQVMFEEALDIWEKNGYQANAARVLGNLGYLYWKVRNLDQAEICLGKAIVLGKELELSHTYNNLGMVRFSQGQYKAAKEAYQQALRCLKTKDNLYDQALFLCNFIEASLRLGNLEAIAEILKNLLTLAQTLQDSLLKADAYWLEGDLNALENNFEKAKESYRRCLGSEERKAEALAKLARLENSLGLAEEAVKLAAIPSSEAALHFVKGDYERARETIASTGDTFEEARLLLDAAYITGKDFYKVTAKKLLAMLH
jgi:DNA-binding SARP family transcriptional activator/Tfp pilus assembly protein PilF